MDKLTDFMFFIDMFISVNTGFYNNGVLVMNRRWILLNYLKFNFWIDVISTFPYSYVVMWMEQFQSGTVHGGTYSQIL